MFKDFSSNKPRSRAVRTTQTHRRAALQPPTAPAIRVIRAPTVARASHAPPAPTRTYQVSCKSMMRLMRDQTHAHVLVCLDVLCAHESAISSTLHADLRCAGCTSTPTRTHTWTHNNKKQVQRAARAVRTTQTRRRAALPPPPAPAIRVIRAPTVARAQSPRPMS